MSALSVFNFLPLRLFFIFVITRNQNSFGIFVIGLYKGFLHRGYRYH